MSESKTDRIKPVKISGVPGYDDMQFVLDFNRDAVTQADNNGFQPDEISAYPMSKIPEFFYYATRMHHRSMSRTQTDKLLKAIGGMTAKILKQLVALYYQAIEDNNVMQDDEAYEKNGVTVELDESFQD